MKGMRYLIPIGSALILICFIIIYFVGFFYENKREAGIEIADDIAHLVSIFKKIDKDCEILSFDYQKNPINFLNVTKFVSSEVGPMNLAYPQNWKGPYVDDNPEMQGQMYQVVRTKQGYFITPGEGVKLPNGKVIGKDIMFSEDADIFAMMGNQEELLYKDKSLAAPLTLSKGKVLMPVQMEP
jgi:hypothetical protein